MTAITASFPAYHSQDVAFTARIPAAVLPEGMRALDVHELAYVSGAGFWEGLARAIGTAFGGLVGLVNPILGGSVAAFINHIIPSMIQPEGAR
jgi:hypothetical protein